MLTAEARIWTSKQGSTVDAELVKIDGNIIHLRRADSGEIITINKDQLVSADAEFASYAALDFEEIRREIADQIIRISSDTYKSRSDQSTANELLRIYGEWIKSYDRNPSDLVPAYKKLQQQGQQIFQRKQIVAYKYNEFLGAEIEVPVVFNLFKDSDSFYFKVGDGDFSTIAPVSISELLSLMDAIQKVQEWKQTCRRERLSTRKEVGRFGGISLEFVSQEEGENIYVWMTAKGPWAKDRMIEEQKVRLTPLNISAIYFHIGRSKELYDARDERRKNAERLK
jgi:hypothetical protein